MTVYFKNMDQQRITEQIIEKIDKEKFGQYVWNQLMSDTQPFSKSFALLIDDYNKATPEIRRTINHVLTTVLGWQLTTLIQQYLELSEEELEGLLVF